MTRNLTQQLNVTRHGRGIIPVVMIHGFGCDQTAWSRLLPRLEAHYRLILLDLPGFGAADPAAFDPGRHGDPAGHAEDVAALCEELDLEGAMMVGHSIGGTIGMMASLLRPGTFRKLCLICSSARYLDEPPHYRGGYSEAELEGLMQLMEQNYLDWAGTLSTVALGDAGTPNHRHDLQQRLLAVPPEVLRPLARSIFFGDTRHLLPRVTTPSVIVQTAHDAIVPMEAAEYLAETLPDGDLVVMQTAGHYPQLTDPETLAWVLRGCLTVNDR
ncbi:alpha/beta fold hydrolase [Halomonas sp. MA07-2]|uniref:alpha/beta fold hydrolase n=1 Tax=Halomonas sp. MA07-2 TaxID=3440841 RepID=UPI003EE9C314